VAEPARRVALATLGVVIDRRRAGEARVFEIGELAEQVAPVVVERDHQRVVGLRQPVQQQPAGIIVVDIGVPHRGERRDRTHRGVAATGDKVTGGADIGDAGRADSSVRPGLFNHPLDDLGVILPLLW